MKIFSRKILRVLLYVFAVVGFIFVSVYFAMQWGLLNVKGSMSARNSYFNFQTSKPSTNNFNDLTINCQINVIGKYAPLTAIDIYRSVSEKTSEDLIMKMIKVASLRFENDSSYQQAMSNCSTANNQELNLPMSAFNWADTDEWNLMKEVFTRDQDVIKKAAADAKISPRIILAGVIGEQFRFFDSRREAFKSYFEPLKILASLSNTSYGIAGLKPKTVATIEANLKNSKSPFYLGASMENIVDYSSTDNIEVERLSRITDTKDPYYSYLYIGLYMKEIETQWKNAGYDISNRPEILATLYNLGFYYSVPKANPEVGGTVINVGGTNYTFGDIAYEFYYSGELSDIFPLEVQ